MEAIKQNQNLEPLLARFLYCLKPEQRVDFQNLINAGVDEVLVGLHMNALTAMTEAQEAMAPPKRGRPRKRKENGNAQ